MPVGGRGVPRVVGDEYDALALLLQPRHQIVMEKCPKIGVLVGAVILLRIFLPPSAW